jgi:hypothetical protein
LGAAGLSLIELPSEILQMVSVDSLIAAESFRFSHCVRRHHRVCAS